MNLWCSFCHFIGEEIIAAIIVGSYSGPDAGQTHTKRDQVETDLADLDLPSRLLHQAIHCIWAKTGSVPLNQD